VKRILRTSAVGNRIGQRSDDLHEFDDRAGPAVRDDDRERVGLRGSLVDEVDVEIPDPGLELIELVETPLLFAPIEVVLPVRDELAHVAHGGAVVPARIFYLVGEPRSGQARP
jgi:hypothetical protein